MNPDLLFSFANRRNDLRENPSTRNPRLDHIAGLHL
jgi:hypothetical protein